MTISVVCLGYPSKGHDCVGAHITLCPSLSCSSTHEERTHTLHTFADDYSTHRRTCTVRTRVQQCILSAGGLWPVTCQLHDGEVSERVCFCVRSYSSLHDCNKTCNQLLSHSHLCGCCSHVPTTLTKFFQWLDVMVVLESCPYAAAAHRLHAISHSHER